MNNISYFYNTIAALHQSYAPHLRIGQTIVNFEHWHLNRYGNDVFYVENNELIARFKEFIFDIEREVL